MISVQQCPRFSPYRDVDMGIYITDFRQNIGKHSFPRKKMLGSDTTQLY